MHNTPSKLSHFNRRDTKVLFAIHYRDGRTAYIRVSPTAADLGSAFVSKLAREAQERGEIPTGTITSAKRVR